MNALYREEWQTLSWPGASLGDHNLLAGIIQFWRAHNRLPERDEGRRGVHLDTREPLDQIVHTALQVDLARRAQNVLAILLHQHLHTRVRLVEEAQATRQLPHVSRVLGLDGDAHDRRRLHEHAREAGTEQGCGEGRWTLH